MVLLPSTLLYFTLPGLYFTPLDSTASYHNSTSLYVALYIILPWLYFTLLDYTLLYNGSTSFYRTLQYNSSTLLNSNVY